MSMTLEISAESGFLYVTAIGVFSLEEAQRTFIEMLEAVVRHQTGGVLFDGRQLTGEPETVERFYYGEFAAEETRNLIRERRMLFLPQFAYVLQYPVLDPARLGETVAVNRGMNVKAFERLDEALQWIAAAKAR